MCQGQTSSVQQLILGVVGFYDHNDQLVAYVDVRNTQVAKLEFYL